MEYSEKNISYTRSYAREEAMIVLYQVEITKISINKILLETLSKNKYPLLISNFIEELVLKTWENKKEIDGEITKHIQQNNWELSRLALLDRNILRLAFYEIKYMNKIPPKVTISEYVSLANKFCTPEQARFIHGLLGQYLKKMLPSSNQE